MSKQKIDWKVGDKAVLTSDIIESTCGDHPAFLLGKKGEIVVIKAISNLLGAYPFLVEGPTNSDKPWYAGYSDLTEVG
jgi:hypothetical protein